MGSIQAAARDWKRRLDAWAFWQLPRAARGFVVAVDLLYLAAVGEGLLRTAFTTEDLLVFGILVGCAIVSIEASLRLVWRRPKAGMVGNDLLAVWTVPVALLLPPIYSALVAIPLLCFVQWRVVKRPPVKLVFSIACTGVAGFVAATARVMLTGNAHELAAHELTATSTTLVAAVVCIVLRYGVNNLLVQEVVALSTGTSRVGPLLRDLEYWGVSAAESCTGVLVAIACLASPYAVLLAIPPVLVLQRTLLLAEFREAARTDAKTGLANSTYWREVADREVSRARSGREQVAVLLVDIDHFKEVNDKHGHLMGDDVLRTVANGLTHGLRPRDFVGRFGGEEFVVLLTGSDLDQAQHAAERIRSHVASLVCEAPTRGEPVQVTISVGVAAFRESGHSVNELLDAADAALYEAKSAGRNCVRVATGSRQQVLDLRGDASNVLDLRGQSTTVE